MDWKVTVGVNHRSLFSVLYVADIWIETSSSLSSSSSSFSLCCYLHLTSERHPSHVWEYYTRVFYTFTRLFVRYSMTDSDKQYGLQSYHLKLGGFFDFDAIRLKRFSIYVRLKTVHWKNIIYFLAPHRTTNILLLLWMGVPYIVLYLFAEAVAQIKINLTLGISRPRTFQNRILFIGTRHADGEQIVLLVGVRYIYAKQPLEMVTLTY